MSKHRRPTLFERALAPVVHFRAFQDRLDHEVTAILNDAGMVVGGVSLNIVVRGDDLPLLRLAAEVMGMGALPTLLAEKDSSALALVARSIKRVHRLSLSHAYESVS